MAFQPGMLLSSKSGRIQPTSAEHGQRGGWQHSKAPLTGVRITVETPYYQKLITNLVSIFRDERNGYRDDSNSRTIRRNQTSSNSPIYLLRSDYFQVRHSLKSIIYLTETLLRMNISSYNIFCNINSEKMNLQFFL